MNQKFIEKMKAQMLEERKQITQSLAKQSEEFRKIIEEQSSGDEIDVASGVINRSMLESLNAQDSNRLQLIESALERIQMGKYGFCIRCNKEIPSTRLEVLPYALMCIDCKAKEERKSR